MGLDMYSKRAIRNEIFRRYQKAAKKGKARILDEYAQTLGYNRDYLARLPANREKTRYAVIHGKAVKFVAKSPPQSRKNTSGGKKGRPKQYRPAFAAVVYDIWEFLEWRRGKLLAPMLRLMIGFPAAGFGFSPDLYRLLLSVSPAAIDRLLAAEKKRPRVKGASLTKPGAPLKHQIPVRVFFAWDERQPGFFELDTVCPCGTSSAGEFCVTLTLTGVCSGWTEVYALRNRAHRWVKEQVAQTAAALPFPLRGIDSDNGGEFINGQLLLWCTEHQISATPLPRLPAAVPAAKTTIVLSNRKTAISREK